MPYLRDINPENIRIWAYDSELYFLEQDEDLMLHRPEFVPALIEMAARDDCPKQQYIKSILEYFIQCSFLYKNDIQLSEIEAAIKESRPFLKTQWLQLEVNLCTCRLQIQMEKYSKVDQVTLRQPMVEMFHILI